METHKINQLLHRYFDGETTTEEERLLEKYFSEGEVIPEHEPYRSFFAGIAELSDVQGNKKLEEGLMDFILESEHAEKKRYRWLWQTVTGIAASILIIFGGILIYEQQQPFKDTFSNPEEARAYAQKTLMYVSGKYNSGLAKLSETGKYNKAMGQLGKVALLGQASKPLSKSLKAVNAGFSEVENLNRYTNSKNE